MHGALYACAYDAAVYGFPASHWCNYFTETEVENFEYELDLLMEGAFGYGLPDNMGPVLGALYVNKLIDRFTNASGDAVPLYAEFGHDTTAVLALTGLGLIKDRPELSADGPVNSTRKWRTSNQVPFGAQMVWEKFECTSSFEGPQIRLVLNDAPLPITVCKNMNQRLGSCSLDDFVTSQAAARNVSWGDATWNATCGDPGF